MFQPVESNVNFPKLEEGILRFWREANIYEKTLERRRLENEERAKRGEPEQKFVFYEGPPTANGMPHPGHCLTRAIKDLFPRYQTMRGKLCQRKAGWDTHGLPVEVEVCKELGIHSKEDIENYKSKTGGPDGIEGFIQLCQQSVWRYMQEWRRMTERIGFWVNLDEAYVTYHQSYVESVWWSLKQLFDRGLLYQGYKIVWWWAQGGTALSAGEVGQGYREVADPSVYVKFPILGDDGKVTDTSLLVWTTTPWTLPSNQFAAVNPNLDYAVWWNLDDNSGIILAESLAEKVLDKVKANWKFNGGMKGSELVGMRYVPPFDYYYTTKLQESEPPLGQLKGTLRSGSEEYIAWRVVAADFVTTDSGTGIVHQAPAFGDVDFLVLDREHDRFELSQLVHNETTGHFEAHHKPRPTLINAVAADGTFTSEGPEYCRGRWVKDCDKDIIHDLKNRGLLFHREEYRHEYPFCWRADEDPLIQYPRRSWFIKTSEFKDKMLENNQQINWLPEHIKNGRFGNFLESNVDWALSRERFWGTPLPIWVCEQTGKMEAVANYEELLAKPGIRGTEVWGKAKAANPNLADDLKVHKPYIDEITYDSPFEKGARMKRVTEVIDCWYDSGAMPFAQWGYQGEGGSGEWGMGNEHKAATGGRAEAPTNATLAPGATGSASAAAPHSANPAQTGFGSASGTLVGSSTLAEPVAPTQKFRQQFPADFISEALDQTRGWFYSQLAISTLLFSRDGKSSGGSPGLGARAKQDDVSNSAFRLLPSAFTAPYPHPFRNCIVLGLMLGEDGQKMSKSKRNYREPGEIFDKYGADALRWYFFATQPPWTTIRYSERAIKDSIPEFLLKLWHTYSFFVIYANIDGFDPLAEIRGQESGGRSQDILAASLATRAACGLAAADLATAASYRPINKRSELDRWILSELNRTAAAVVERMDQYDNYTAAQKIIEFIDALSNWYVRRSRDRFWSEDKRDPDKLDAYWTLYECLLTAAKIVAPFVPFLAEAMWGNLAGFRAQGSGFSEGDRSQGSGVSGQESSAFRLPPSAFESVHLCDYPTGDPGAIDEKLSAQMNLVREIASLGLSARMGAKLKVRQPLAKVEVILATPSQQAWLEDHLEIIRKELNVKNVEFTQKADQYITYTVLPDLKRLGPRLGKKLPAVKNALAKADGGKLLAELETAGSVTLKLDAFGAPGESEKLDRDDLQVRLQAKPGWAAAQGKACVVVLATEISPELITEGVAREIVHAIQTVRKDKDCEYTDRIEIGIVTDSAEIRRAVEQFADYIQGETLAISILLKPIDGVEPIEVKIGDATAQLFVQIMKN